MVSVIGVVIRVLYRVESDLKGGIRVLLSYRTERGELRRLAEGLRGRSFSIHDHSNQV
jgi:hypothetical protein